MTDKTKVTNQKFIRLKELLMELFQLDQPELDFGLYRVMHARAKEVTQFLEKDLLPQVSSIFAQYQSADSASLKADLDDAIEQAKKLGIDPDASPKVKELKEKVLGGAIDISRLESEVYDHLYTFFRRYYHEGDFLSRRVYKDGVYSIPYSGEEVKLHWANADQYYIKTDEYLKDYSFRLNPNDEKNPMRVHFRIRSAAEGEHGNIKAQENGERRFVLCESNFIEEEEGETGTELIVNFEYRPSQLNDWAEDQRQGKKAPPAQKDLISIALKRVTEVSERNIKKWMTSLLAPAPSAQNAQRTSFEKHLDRYTKRNAFDYFIHKDLGGFLHREIDFYIKNEVMHLDDIESETSPKVEQYLSKIKAIRKIASKIIDFLAQLEDFQKKLWLKKKFVVETNYCITLDRIPEEFYPEIAANVEQQKEWKRLFCVEDIETDLLTKGYSEPLTVDFLKANQNLFIDTVFYRSHVAERIIDAVTTGGRITPNLLIHGDNFAALRFLENRYRGRIGTLYIDPPYNTTASEILYKNDYKHSSWLSLIQGRLNEALGLLREDAIACVTIDDAELHGLWFLLSECFGQDNHLATALIRNNPQGRSTVKGFAINHEYALFFARPSSDGVGRLERTDEQNARYGEKDENGHPFLWENFRKTGTDSHRADRPKQFYPLFFNGVSWRVPKMEWNNTSREWVIKEKCAAKEVELLPVDDDGTHRVWKWGFERAILNPTHIKIEKVGNSGYQVYRRNYLNQQGALPGTWWDKPKYAAGSHGTNLLTDIFGEGHLFSFPKSVFAVEDCLRVGQLKEGDVALDFFGGSGTTAHAVINLNRTGEEERFYILAEISNGFSSVLKPRILRAAYSPTWDSGKPTSRTSGISHMFKYVQLESYEDALNNLETTRAQSAQLTLESHQAQGESGFKEQYMLKYMLDVETKGSQSLLNIQDFKDPTAYKMKIKRPGTDESKLVNVDLLETFNWLLGLTVDHIAAPQTFTTTFKRDDEKRLVLAGQLKQKDDAPWWFRTVAGKDPEGRNVLVIWRKRPGNDEPEGIEQDNLVLNEWFKKLGFSTKDREFDLIYVNGTNNLENARAADETWKVRLIEEDFMRLMFDVEEL